MFYHYTTTAGQAIIDVILGWAPQHSTFNITKLSITTFSIMDLILALSISINWHYAECRHAECRVLFIVIAMLNASMLNVIMLNVMAP